MRKKLLLNNKFSILFVFSIIFLLYFNVITGFAQSGESRTLLQSIGKGLGVFTTFLLVIGFGYVLLNRGYVLLRTQLPKTESHQIILDSAKEFYSKYRKPAFYIHVSINTIAIIFGILHGLTVLIRSELQAYLGWLAVIVMMISSLSGYIMWLKIRPIWDSKDIRSVIRASHRQWILTFILVSILFLHVILSQD